MFDQTRLLTLTFIVSTLAFGSLTSLGSRCRAQPAPASEPPASSATITPAAAAAARARPSNASDSEGAAPDKSEHASTASRAGIGLVAAAGLHTGLALGARLGLGEVGLEIEAGYQPIIAVWQEANWLSAKGNSSHVDLGSSGQLAAELYATPWRPQKSSAIGLKGGYRYNSMLTHGFAVAVTYLIELSDHLALEGLAGGSFFPGSGDTLRRKLGLPSNAQLVYTSSAQFFEYGFELIYYP